MKSEFLEITDMTVLENVAGGSNDTWVDMWYTIGSVVGGGVKANENLIRNANSDFERNMRINAYMGIS